MPPKSTRRQFIPNHRYLQFDIFDALGLDPSPTLSRRDINRAYQRVVLIVHPDHRAANRTFVPTFPTVQQAQDARNYLLGANHRVRRAHSLLWRNHRSTWNPNAVRGTAAVLQPRVVVSEVPDTDEIPDSPDGSGGPRPPPPPPRPSQPSPRPGRRNPSANGTSGPQQKTSGSKRPRASPRPSAQRRRRWATLWTHASPDRVFVGHILNNGRRFAVEAGLDTAGRLTFRRLGINFNGTQNPPFVGPQRTVVARNNPALIWLAPFAGMSEDPTAIRYLIQRILAMRNSGSGGS